MESKNGINKCCSECHFYPQNRGGGSSDPCFGSKNGFLGTWRGGQLLFTEGAAAFSRQMVSQHVDFRGSIYEGVTSEVKMTNVMREVPHIWPPFCDDLTNITFSDQISLL